MRWIIYYCLKGNSPTAAVADTLCIVFTVTEIGKVNTPDTSSMASQRNWSASLAEYTNSVNWNSATKVRERLRLQHNVYFAKQNSFSSICSIDNGSPSLSTMVTTPVGGSGMISGLSVEMLTLNLSICSTSGSSVIGMSAQDLLTVELNISCTTVPS